MNDARLLLVIGNRRFSSWSLRPWLALKRCGVAFDEELIGLDLDDSRARIAARTPAGRVPVLVDGDFTVWESLAICEYLAERFPEARLWPEDRLARAHARTISCEMHAGFASLRRQMSMDLQRPPAPLAEGVITDETRRDVARIIEIWTGARERFGRPGDDGFLFGRYSIADAMFAPVVCRFRHYAVPLSGSAARYAEAVWSDPALGEWVASAQGEALIARYHV